MPRITAEQAGGPNVCAFLDTIAVSEGTQNDPVTQDDGYDVLVTGIDGPARFASYATHPNVLVQVNHDGLCSTAAGRYQLLYKYWVYYQAYLHLPDFSPVSQDLIAIQQIRERRALPMLAAGNIAGAIAACSNIWASLPGNTYGQRQNKLQALVEAYQQLGGSCQPSAS